MSSRTEPPNSTRHIHLTVIGTPLSPLCHECHALCCTALAFDREQGFALDKPANVRCIHLTPEHRCAIYSERAQQGFKGCVGFSCHGAGQRASRPVSDDSALSPQVAGRFRRLLVVHELLWQARNIRVRFNDVNQRTLVDSLVELERALVASPEPDDEQVNTWQREATRLFRGASPHIQVHRQRSVVFVGRVHFAPPGGIEPRVDVDQTGN